MKNYVLGEASLSRLLPNILTMLALCAGMTSIRFAIQERWEAAVIALIIAAVFDSLDGRAARLLKAQSKFGAELDSLSDVISFGVAPAIINYLWILKEVKVFGWVAALIFTVCTALRLARFNARLGASDLPSWASRFFTGVPSPMGAGLALLPLIVSFEIGRDDLIYPYVVCLWLAAAGGLMISRLPTFSFKDVRIARRFIFPVLVGVGLFAAALASAPWVTLALVGLAYLVSLPISYRQFKKREEESPEEQMLPFSLAPVQTQPEE